MKLTLYTMVVICVAASMGASAQTWSPQDYAYLKSMLIDLGLAK